MNENKQTDQELWQVVRRGGASEMGEIYSRHARAVACYVLKRTADPDLADEVTSQVFLEAWAGRSRLRLRGEGIRPLLLGMATNLIHNSWRQAARRRRLASRVESLERAFEVDESDLSLERIDAKARIESCRAELENLPAKLRDVVALLSLGDLTYEETAAALGLPVGTVRSRMARARKRLRDGSPLASREPESIHTTCEGTV